MNLPNRVTLELTNRCNRSCVSCPRLKTDYPLGDMSLELLKKILDQLPSDTCIVPFFRGESLIHPRFYDIMKLFRRFKTVQLATNGDLLTLDNQNAILKSCTFVSYSLHTFGYPTDFMSVVNFLGRARNNDISTQVSILDTVISEDKELFIKEWLEYVDRVRIYVEHSAVGFGDVSLKYRTISESLLCRIPLNDMVVYWDGRVALCCYDWDNKLSLGNLNDRTIESVWNGEVYNKVRLLHRTGRRKQVESCKDCDYWMIEYLPSKMFGEVYKSG